jgi:hypothetical protein
MRLQPRRHKNNETTAEAEGQKDAELCRDVCTQTTQTSLLDACTQTDQEEEKKQQSAPVRDGHATKAKREKKVPTPSKKKIKTIRPESADKLSYMRNTVITRARQVSSFSSTVTPAQQEQLQETAVLPSAPRVIALESGWVFTLFEEKPLYLNFIVFEP